MDKIVFLYWWLSFDLSFYLVLGGKNNVLRSMVKKNYCALYGVWLYRKSLAIA